jgi:hypothetical protein
MNFTYIIEKIKNAQIIEHPFHHLDIQNLLSEEHLNLIINDGKIYVFIPKYHGNARG